VLILVEIVVEEVGEPTETCIPTATEIDFFIFGRSCGDGVFVTFIVVIVVDVVVIVVDVAVDELATSLADFDFSPSFAFGEVGFSKS